MKTILIVDDIQSIREHYEMVLRQGGFTTVQAKDGLEALAMVEANPVDLVVLDLRMPKLSGKEFISRIRGNPAKKDLPILAVSAEAFKHARELVAVNVRLIAKPVQGDQLLSTVKSMLS